MKIIDLYIGKSFTRCFLLVLSILGFLFSFFEFILELDEVGKGHYQLNDALSYVLLTLPGRLLDLIPHSSLLGGIIALGLLADKNELVAMNAGGISVRRICLVSHCGCNTSHAGGRDSGRVYCAALGAASTDKPFGGAH